MNTEDLFQSEKVWVLGPDKINMDENLHLVLMILYDFWRALVIKRFDSLHTDLRAQRYVK